MSTECPGPPWARTVVEVVTVAEEVKMEEEVMEEEVMEEEVMEEEVTETASCISCMLSGKWSCLLRSNLLQNTNSNNTSKYVLHRGGNIRQWRHT